MWRSAIVLFALAWTIPAIAQCLPADAPKPPATANSAAPSSPDGSPANSPAIPGGTNIVGVLTSAPDTKHSKTGDAVGVEVTEDAHSDGHLVLKKGSRIAGQITQVSAFSKGVYNAKLEIVFDKIIPKDGPEISTHLAICALAAKPDESTNDIQDGRGLVATNDRVAVAGHMGTPAGGGLDPTSRGLFRLDAMSLLPMARFDPPTSLVRSTSKNVHLDKGTQIVLEVVNP